MKVGISSLRLLWISDSPLLNTGYAKIGRELLPRLARQCGTVAAAGWFHPAEGATLMGRVKVFPADNDYSGRAMRDILDQFRPDLVIGLGDLWMFDWWSSVVPGGSIPFIGYALLDGRLDLDPVLRYLARADHVVAATHFTAGIIEASGGAATPPVIPFGVDTTIFRPAEDGVAVRTGRRQAVDGSSVALADRFIVGCVARNQPRKQFPLLLDAFARFAAGKPEALLYLHTAAQDAGWDLDTLVRQHGIANRTIISRGVTAHEGVPERALAGVYHLFDVFALPTMGEGFGLPFLEAMASGVPTVGTDCSAVTELLDGRGVLLRVQERPTLGRYHVEQALADPDHLAEALNELYCDPALRAELGRRGRAFAEQHTWDVCADRWIRELEPFAASLRASEVAVPDPLSGLSVVIATHGELELTQRCLEQLRIEAPEAEIICVDNGSPDGTLAWLRGQTGLIVQAFPENRGVPLAWNSGLAAATGDLLCVLNNDVELHPGGLRALAQAARERGIAALQGGCLDAQLEFAGFTDDPAAADYPDGCALMFRRDVYTAVGPFDEGMGLGYYEDVDWGLRARRAGYAWAFVPDALTHLVAGTARHLPEREALLQRNAARLRDRWRRRADGTFEPAGSTSDDDPAAVKHGVSVVIPTTGGGRAWQCVETLRAAAAEVPLQIILVVTGGADALPACDEVVRCERPFNWSRANNAALQVADRPFVLLLNDDAFFTQAGDLGRMLAVMEQWPYLAALGPVSPGISPYFQQYGEAPVAGGLFVATGRPLCGHCLLIRRECFEAVGPFDEGFAVYGGDELDWLYRAHQLGYRWGIHEGVFVHHEGAATYGARAQEWQPGKARFEAKHGVSLELAEDWHSDRPLVSWVIASHEGARYLSHCLDSLRRCSESLDYEIVLAVDGSDPAPYRAVLQHYADLPLRTTYFSKASTVGIARNRALRLARGHYILPFDDDDVALADRRRLVDALSEADIAYGHLRVCWMTGECSDFPRQDITFLGLLEQHGATIIPPHATAMRRDLIDRYYFCELLPACEDYELWLRMTRDGIRLHHLPDAAVTLYLQRPGSCSQRADLDALNRELRQEYRPYVPEEGPTPEHPVYSYVITVWNEAERLGRCLESLVACAPDEPFEVVLADDGSDDETLNVARAYLDRLPLRIHPFPKAPTVAVAYNRVLRHARGEYLLIMDADDETMPERVPALRAVLDATGADFVYGSYVRIWPDREELYRPPDWSEARRSNDPAISPCAAIFRRRILDGGVWFREELAAGEDRVWMLDIDAAGYQIVAATEVCAHRYWITPGSVVHRFPVQSIVTRYSPSRDS